ncbi:MAG: glutamine--scyllo-inositol aminotransferase [Chloroflexi bacterium RBG_16_52_11]|nr:MAG: glutamine--scyllo-inositol aminotransferase [Chloroflexi bacterium RBG_16_52_11]
MIRKHIPVSAPWLNNAESECVNDALKQGAISGFYGEYLPLFEKEFSEYCECSYGVAVSSGTTALHLALVTLGIKGGDEVLVSTLTNMATIFAILYIGANPIPIDIEPETLNLDPRLLDHHVTPRTKAILVVHLFGHPVDMDPVLEFARQHDLFVVEDCAEAHGATYKGGKVGGLGDAGCFSFYANKIITTGEGGMVTFRDKSHADRARNLKGLAFGDTNKFMHNDIGYNYRMTNLQAAIGHAQFLKIEQIISRKREIAKYYSERFVGMEGVQLPVEKPYARNVYWMYHLVLVGRNKGRRKEVMQFLANHGIETRDTFIPCNLQDVFIEQGWVKPDSCPEANAVAYAGFYLPSGPELTKQELEYIATKFIQIIKNSG